MRGSIIYILVFLFICSFSNYAQNTNPLDQQNKPLASSIFGSDAKKTTASGGESERTNNSITFPMTTILHSEFGLKYERSLGSYLSFGFGLSKSFADDYMDRIFRNIQEDGDGLIENTIEESCSFYYLQNNSKFRSGYAYEFFVRVYPIKDDICYIDLSFKNKQKTYLIQKSAEFQNSDYNVSVSNFTLTYGNKWTFGNGAVKFVHELNYGLGARFFYWDNYLQNSLFDQWGNANGYYYTKDNTNTDKRPSAFMPFLVFRYSIGFGW